MTMATSESPFSQLRRLLDTTEQQIVVMHETPSGVLEVMDRLGQIDRLLAQLAGPEFDARGEESRAEALRERLLREADRVVRLVTASGQATQLGGNPLWQQVQASVAARQRRQRWRIGGAAIGLLLLGLILFVVLPWLFPATPQADSLAVGRAVEEGNLPGALATAQAEQARVPTDADIAVWVGALQQQQGNSQAAEAAWNQARQLYGSEISFLVQRGLVQLQLSDYSGTERDARTLIGMPTGGPQGYFLLGSVQEARGEYRAAMQSFEQAANLAEQANMPELVVAARTRMAYLTQQP